MILAAHQLHYLPWLRYFHKIAQADVFVILDNIQFTKNDWHNRNKIKGSQGALILTVPVLHKFGQPLCDVQIDNKQPWRRKHWGSISNYYSKAPYFKDHEPFLKKIYETDWEKLNDINYEMFFYFSKALGIKTQIVRSSEMPLQGEATARLIEICKQSNAMVYMTGAYAAEVYLDPKLFEQEGIQLLTHSFDCPKYTQQFSDVDFVPELSILDLLLNCGPKSFEILMSASDYSAHGEAK